jgi:hypothetical protein
MVGFLDALARARGMDGFAAPASHSLIQALLAKHGASMPTAKAGDGMVAPPAPGPDIKPPGDMSAVVDSLPTVKPLDQLAVDPALAATASPPTMTYKPGVGDRIGDFLKSNDGRATMMRFAAGAFNGGFGGGLNAATRFADERGEHEASAAEHAAEMALRQKQIDNVYNLGLGRLDIDALGTEETGRHNRSTEGIDRSRIQSDLYRHDTPSGDTRARVAEDRFQHTTPSGDTVTTQAGENYRHGAVSGDTAATQAGEDRRNTADNQTQIMRDRIARAPTISTHAHYTTTPEEYARNGPRLRPSEVKPMAGDQGVVSVASDADYAALASGTKFKGPDGQIRVKP